MLVGVNYISLTPDGSAEEWYLRTLLSTMKDIQSEIRFLILTDDVRNVPPGPWEKVCLDRVGNKGVFGKGNAQLDEAMSQADVDLLFSPLGTAPAKTAVPIVAFALDLRRCEEDHVKRFRGEAGRLKTVKRVAENAIALVAPSEFVRTRFRALLDVPFNKVVVAPLGVDDVFAEDQPCIVEQPYLLTVGGTNSFRNIARLRKVFGQLEDEIPHALVVAGRPGDAEPDDWGERALRIERCPSRYLAGLYQHCEAFIQPSLYEGSGVSVLEAMRAGALVVTSRTGGITEVAHDIPIFFNAESVSSMLAAIRRALAETPAERKKRAKYAKRIAADYRWDACAWRTIYAFRRMQ